MLLRTTIRSFALILSILFLASAVMNLGFQIPLGFTVLSFSAPSSTIATFEVLIGGILLAASIFSSLYFLAGAYILAVVGIVEGLVSPDIQGLARAMHEMMLPFAIFGSTLLIFDAAKSYSTRKYAGDEKRREIITVLQFFVGALVTLGGAAFARFGRYPVGTALGLVHLVVGVGGLIGGYYFMKRKPWAIKFLIGMNSLTITYSSFSETLAQFYDYLTPGITDSLIGSIVAVVLSTIILCLVTRKNQIPKLQETLQVK
jgi:hypothetical protein